MYTTSKARLSNSLLAGSVLWLASCGEPPSTPQLPGHDPSKVERLVLDDRLEPRDIRDIFDALNENGQLESLAPLVRDTSDEQLSKLGAVLNEHVFQTAQDPGGLIALLGARISERDFSKLKNSPYLSGKNRLALSDLLSTFANSELFVDLLERDIGLLAPSYDSLFGGGNPAKPSSKPTPFDAEALKVDLEKILAIDGLRESWLELSSSLTDSWAAVGLLRGLRRVSAAQPKEAWTALSADLKRLAETPRDATKGPVPTQYDALMELMLALSEPSDGLFTQIEKALLENEKLVRDLGNFFQPGVPVQLGYFPIGPNTITGILLARLQRQGAPTGTRDFWLQLGGKEAELSQKAFAELFKTVRSSHESIVGVSRKPFDVDFVTFNLPIFLNTYVLCEWLQRVARDNHDAISKIQDDAWPKSLWDLKVKTAAVFESSFIDEPPPGQDPSYIPARLTELREFGLGPFVDLLEHKPPKGLGGFQYRVELEDPLALGEAIRSAMVQIDGTRGYADGSSLVRAAIDYLIRPRANGKSLLASLESDSLLVSAHRMLFSFPEEVWQEVLAVAFQGIGAGELSDGVREFLSGFFEGRPDLLKKFEKILASVGVVQTLSAKTGKGPSAFQTYVGLVQQTGPEEWKVLARAWEFVALSGLLSFDAQADGKTSPRFPAVYRLLLESDSVGLFDWLARLTPAHHGQLAALIDRSLGERNGAIGAAVHWDFLQQLLEKAPTGAVFVIEMAQTGGGKIRQELTAAERAWIVKFIESGAFADVWETLAPYLVSGKASAWASELKRLSEAGTLKAAFGLMKLIRSDRMTAIGEMLESWDDSGELLALLQWLEGPPVNAPPSP